MSQTRSLRLFVSKKKQPGPQGQGMEHRRAKIFADGTSEDEDRGARAGRPTVQSKPPQKSVAASSGYENVQDDAPVESKRVRQGQVESDV
jgi:hypothetical protein